MASVLLGTTFFIGAASADESRPNQTINSDPTTESVQTSTPSAAATTTDQTNDESGSETDSTELTVPTSSATVLPEDIASEKSEVATPTFSGMTNWEPNNSGHAWTGNAADAIYKAGDTANITYTIQSWGGTNVDGSQDYQGSTQYLIMIPAGFDTSTLTPNRSDAALGYSLQDLGNVGPNDEHTFLLTLAQTPSYSNPLNISATITPTATAGGAFSGYNQWSPLLMPLSDHMNATSDSSTGGGTGTITLKNGTTYEYVRDLNSFNNAQWWDNNSKITYTIIPGVSQLATSNYEITNLAATKQDATQTGAAGYEEIDPTIKITGTVNNGDYIDFHLGIPYVDSTTGQTAYELYDSNLSKLFTVPNIGTVYNMGTFYRLVFNNQAGLLNNPDFTLQLRWGSTDNQASLNKWWSNYVYQETDDPNKDHTTFTYQPTNDVNINGQIMSSGFSVNGTYIYSQQAIGVGNTKIGVGTSTSYNRTWNQNGEVAVNTNWVDAITASLSTTDSGDEFDLKTTITKDPSGLVNFTFTTADEMKKAIENDIATNDTQKLSNQVVNDNGTYVKEDTTKGEKPKVDVNVTMTTTTDPNNPNQTTAIWHIKLTNLDPTTNPKVVLNGSVTTVIASANNFTMPTGITSYNEDVAQKVTTNNYSGAKTGNEALMNDLENLPIATTQFISYKNGKPDVYSGVFGGPWSASIMYNGNSSVDGGGSSTDLVTETIGFVDTDSNAEVGTGLTYQGATGTTISFNGLQSAYDALNNYQFVKAVSVDSEGNETELTNLDPTKLDTYSFGKANKNIVKFIIYVKNTPKVAQNASLSYVDDDAKSNQSNILIANGSKTSGSTGSQITFADLAQNINELQKQHYIFNGVTSGDRSLAGGNDQVNWNNIFGTYDSDQNTTQNFVIHFKHQTQDVARSKTVTETIRYQYADSSKAADDNTQSLIFKQTGTKDLVTNVTSYGQWTPSKTFAAVSSPSIAGYTPNKAIVERKTITVNNDNYNNDLNVKTIVTYTADDMTATITYIDDTSGKTLKTDTVTGKVGDQINFSTAPSDQIKTYQGQHYDLVSNDFTDKAKYSDGTNIFTVHLKHHISDTSEVKTVTRTVNYVIDGGSATAPDSQEQTVTFTGTGYKDDVTGQLVDLNDDGTVKKNADGSIATGALTWTVTNGQADFAEVDSPSVDGYHVVSVESATKDQQDGNNVKAITVNHDSSNITVTVHYAQNQSAILRFVDDDANGLEIAKALTAQGTAGTQIQFDDVATVVSQLKNKGYVLKDTTDDTPAASTLFTALYAASEGREIGDSTTTDWTNLFGDFTVQGGQIFSIHFSHGHGDLQNKHQQTVNETIHYVKEDQSSAAPDVQYHLTFTGSGYYDQVTKQDVITKWQLDGGTADDGSFAAVTNPTVSGYHVLSAKTDDGVDVLDTNQNQVKAQSNLNHESKDINVTVTYAADPQPTDQTEPVRDTKTVHETIHYLYSNGTSAHADYVGTPITFTRTGTKDLTTGITSWNPWTPTDGEFAAVVSPVIADATPDQTEISAQSVSADSTDLVFTVIYTKNSQPAPSDTPSPSDTPAHSDQPAPSSTPQVPDMPATSDQPNMPASSATSTEPAPSATPTPVESSDVSSQELVDQTDQLTTLPVSQSAAPANQTKAQQLPQTGNQTNSTAVIGLGLLSALGLFGLDKLRKKD